ncbi:alpha/beta hydrolase [Nocardioides sp. NPDC126508]
MKYFVGQGEDLLLDDRARRGLRGSFLELSQGVTHYELSGPEDGETVVLTGGLTVPLFYWDGLVEHLHGLGLRTLAYSAYGRGYSQRLRCDYDEALFVGQLAELVDTLRLPRHHVVGTSMGAVIAMAYVAGRSDIKSLTLAGPAGLSAAPASRWLLKSDHAAAFVGRRLGRRLLENHLDHNVRDDASAAALTRMVHDAFRYQGSIYALFSTLQNLPLYGRAELFRSTGHSGIPTMLLWGDDDHVTPIASLEEARTLLQPRQCHVVTQCGHMTPLERPDEVADLIAAFTTNQKNGSSNDR